MHNVTYFYQLLVYTSRLVTLAVKLNASLPVVCLE